MSWPTLDMVCDADGIARLTLNRPDARNALDARMIDDLTDAARRLGDDSAVRAVILSGAGPVFCAGGDLRWMQAQMRADRATRMAEARKLAEMLLALNEMPVPLIGAIHGGAFGGGVGLACVCDVALAADNCRFGLTETLLGLIPATIAPYVLARIGEGGARQVFMSARVFGAPEAARLGVVARVVPPEALEAAAAAEAAPYLQTSRAAVGAAKGLARALGPRIDAKVIEDTVTRLADIWETPDAAAGIAAFLARRAPDGG
ncbi:crotonase/enoyl-CoA hydratase family protein [Meridianimarinicoccus roseus]|uniref:Crotonase/enoyl-CoA hydratase family protein n=1 Tax=Meridianimarinicoccus roseus TaxID=2072018 RepID=A0A2V2LF31_9RHOB|nr:crotonase/enoyl-CoA hydratase family protein [Meridianimarinicoccus roseus]PWR03632.1 crotonase/enoyl-CoA hydratase family protein [Meridianimarinicoccus roseus]